MENKIIIGAAIFLLLYQLEEDKNFKGRRLVKKVIRVLKKRLSIIKNEIGINEYNKLVYKGRDFAVKTKDLYMEKYKVKDISKIVVTP